MSKYDKIDVNKLIENSKRFGPKLPSNNDDQEFHMINAIMCGLGMLGWGKKVVNPANMYGLLNNKNNLFYIISDANKSINSIKKDIHVLHDIKQDINTSKTYLKELRNSIINKQNNQNNNDDILKILNSIKQTLENNISAKGKDSFVIKGDTNSVEFINALNNLLKNDEDSFKKVNEVLNSVTFENFVQNIKDLNEKLAGIHNINVLETFIETIAKLSEIDFNSLKGSDKILIYIKNNLINNIIDILNKLREADDNAKEFNITNRILALQQIISTIPNIASLNLKDLLWSRISINYLSYFIKDKIPLIFESLNSILDNNSNIGETVSKIDKCINSLISIFKLDTKELEDNRESLLLINSLISNELNSVIDTLRLFNQRTLDSIILKLEKINKLISDIDDIQKLLPSIFSIIKSTIKLDLITDELHSIDRIIYHSLGDSNLIQSYIDNIVNNLRGFKSVIEVLNDINGNIKNINTKSILKILFTVSQELIVINSLAKKLNKLNKEYETPITFTGLNETIKNFNNILNSLDSNYDDKLDKITAVSSFIDSFIILLNNLDISLLSEEKTEQLDNFFKNIVSIIKGYFVTGSSLSVSLRALDLEVNEDILKKIDIIDKAVTKIALLANLKLLQTISAKSLDPLVTVTDSLYKIVEKFKLIKEDDVKGANEMLNSLMKLVIGTSAVLIFGALIMNYINIASLLSFTVSLGLFITGILWVYSKITKEQLESSFASAKDLGLLIALSGAVLVFGSLFMRFINIDELFGFTAALGLFISGILFVYSIFSKKLKETFSSAFELGLLIAISGGTLILGSLLFHLINWEDLWGFGTALGVFMFGILGIYSLFNIFFKNALKGAKDFVILIGVSAGLLVLGGLIGEWVIENWSTIWRFGLALAAFTIMIGAPWILGSLWFKNALKGAKEFAILITVSAAIMILGPMFIDALPIGSSYWEKYAIIGAWALLLGVFVIGVGFALYLANKNSKSSIAGALALSLAVGISAAALIAGPILLKEYGVNPMDVLIFGAILVGFIGVMTWMLKNVGDELTTILKGALGVIAIGLLVFGAAYVLTEFYNSVKDINFMVLLKGIAKMVAVFGAMTAMAAGLGALVSGPQAAILAAGAAALGVLEGLVWGAAKVMNAIGIGMITINKAAGLFIGKDGKFDVTKVQNILELVNAFGNILKLLTDKISLKMAGKLTAIMPGVILGIHSLSMIGNVVKDWANMWVPDVDPKTGKTKGYRKLTNEEISAAIQNIGNVLTAIGKAIVEVTKDPNNKDIFGEGFLSGKSPFRVAMESFKYSGDILSGIAESIKSWSSMAIPAEFDKKGRPKRYTTLNDAELKNTKENIKKVLVGIGSAICEVVNNNKELFETGDRSPAMIAAKAIKESASALLDITNVIKVFSSKDFKTIIDKLNDPKNGALGNVNKVVSGIVNILKIFLDPYKENTRGVIAKWFVGEKTFVENLNDNRGEISKSAETVKIFCNNIEAIFKAISDLGTNVSKNKDGLMFVADSGFATSISNALGNLVKFTNDFLNLDQSDIGDVNKNKDMFNTYCKSVITIYKAIASIGDEIEKNRNGLRFVANKLLMTHLSLALNNLKDFTIGILGINQDDINKLNDRKDKFAVFKDFTELLDSFIESINKYNNESEKRLMLLSQGIIVLYLSTKQIGQNILYKGFVNDTKDFVEKINSLDINKLYSMNNLINSMNELAQRLLNLGDLNELTETLANKVTSVLLELVNQLNHAEAVITNAHKLQEKRKELIEKSVKTIRGIMSQNMIVKVGKLSDEESKLLTINNQPTNDNSNPNPSGSSESSTPLSNPEETKQPEKSNGSSKANNYENSLTKDQFINLMMTHMKDYWK